MSHQSALDLPSVHDSVVRFLSRRLADGDAVDELAQEAIFRCVERTQPRRSQVQNIKAFAVRIARNLWLDRHRSQARRAEPELTHEYAAASELRPSRVAGSSEQRDMVNAALDGLPQSVRNIVLMRHHDDLSLREIADRIAEPYEVVRKRYTRALTTLRTKLGAPARS